MTRTRGFTLIEVMIARVVLAIGLLATMGLVARGIQETASARKLTTAQLLGGQVLERLRAEVRFDGEPTVSSGNSGFASGDGAFTLDNAWRAERLPYASTDAVGSATGGALQTCNPADRDDGLSYDVGPYRLRTEGNEFFVCYRLEPTAMAGLPAHSVDATIKVLWRTADGWAARWVAGPVLSGG